MPLQDHFRAPLWPKRDWHSFHNAWATAIAAGLNAVLPKGFFAEPNVKFGIEIDVGTYEDAAESGAAGPGTAWRPPSPQLTIDLPVVEDIVEVGIFHPAETTRLVAAIELVSPANKDRLESRDAFVSKCAAYMQQGVGLLIVDVVTASPFDLHGAVLTRLGSSPPPAAGALYAASYRPAIGEPSGNRLEIWCQAINLGDVLPTMPLALAGGPCLPVDLEVSYEKTRHDLRIGVNDA
jgi:hypothetical protein